jgi:hypothetical protein
MSSSPKLDFSDIVANKENRQRWREENERIQREKEAQLKQKELLRMEREKRRLERQEKRMEEQEILRLEKEKNQLASVTPTPVALVTEPVKETPTQPEIVQNPFKSMNPFTGNNQPVSYPNYQQPAYQLNQPQMMQAPTPSSVYTTPLNGEIIHYDRSPMENNFQKQPRSILRGPAYSNSQEEYRPKRARFEEYSDEFSSEDEQPAPTTNRRPPMKRFRIEPVLADQPLTSMEEPKQFPPLIQNQPVQTQQTNILPTFDGSFLYSYAKPAITNLLWGGALFCVMLARGYLSQAYQSHQESLQFNDRPYTHKLTTVQTPDQTSPAHVAPTQSIPSTNYTTVNSRSSTFDFVK